MGRDDASCWWIHEAGASGFEDATDGAVRACDRADAATPSTSSEQVAGGNDGAAQDRKRLLAK